MEGRPECRAEEGRGTAFRRPFGTASRESIRTRYLRRDDARQVGAIALTGERPAIETSRDRSEHSRDASRRWTVGLPPARARQTCAANTALLIVVVLVIEVIEVSFCIECGFHIRLSEQFVLGYH